MRSLSLRLQAPWTNLQGHAGSCAYKRASKIMIMIVCIFCRTVWLNTVLIKSMAVWDTLLAFARSILSFASIIPPACLLSILKGCPKTQVPCCIHYIDLEKEVLWNYYEWHHIDFKNVCINEQMVLLHINLQSMEIFQLLPCNRHWSTFLFL